MKCSGNRQKFCKDEKCEDCFKRSFASHTKSEFWSSKNKIEPRWVFLFTNTVKYIFDCTNCNHEFESYPSSISRQNVWCSICSGRSVCGKQECSSCYERSFAIHFMAENWSDKNLTKPNQECMRSGKKFWFDCPNCPHDFETTLANLSRKKDKLTCKYCSSNSKELCDDENCDFCFEKSFADHPKSRFWHSDNIFQPRQVTKRSEKFFKFQCYNCPHSFKKALHSITNPKKNPWCPYCCNPPQKLCCDEDCKMCFNNSFASHEKSQFWSENNKLTPRQVFKGTSTKYLLLCGKDTEDEHEFTISISAIAKKEKPSWCNICTNKTEKKLLKWLNKSYTVEFQKSFDWCKSVKGNSLRYDFYFPDLNLIVELDGEQHFKQVSNWKSPENTQKTDKIKMNKAIENGMTVIRVYQPDVYYDSFDWKSTLKNSIKKYDKPEKIFISKDKNIYNVYID